MAKETKETILMPDSFYYGTELAAELAKLRTYIIEMAACIEVKPNPFELPDFACQLLLLNYLIENVEYKYQD